MAFPKKSMMQRIRKHVLRIRSNNFFSIKSGIGFVFLKQGECIDMIIALMIGEKSLCMRAIQVQHFTS